MRVQWALDRKSVAAHATETLGEKPLVDEFGNGPASDVGRRGLQIRTLGDSKVIFEPLRKLAPQIRTTKGKRRTEITPVVSFDAATGLERV
jgi:hypothetical protein